jgi:preprotein translocase subunit SecE
MTSQGLIRRGAGNRGGVIRFFAEAFGELRKCVWPTREEVVRLTGIVIVIAGIIGFALGVLDFIFTQTLTQFLFS